MMRYRRNRASSMEPSNVAGQQGSYGGNNVPLPGGVNTGGGTSWNINKADPNTAPGGSNWGMYNNSAGGKSSTGPAAASHQMSLQQQAQAASAQRKVFFSEFFNFFFFVIYEYSVVVL